MTRRILILLSTVAFLRTPPVVSQCQPIADTTGLGKLRAFHVPGVGMSPTIAPGNFVLVDTTARVRSIGIERGDMVVFRSPEEPELMATRRVVARAGDTVAMHRGQTVLNHQRLPEPYAVHHRPAKSEDPFFRKKMRQWQETFRPYPTKGQYEADLQDWGPLVLPDNALFVLGDNRDTSYDSRYYGFVPDTAILGPVIMVIDTAGRCIRWRSSEAPSRK